MIEQLDKICINWSDFEAAGHQSRELLKQLVGDKRSLRELVYGVEKNPKLLGMCERHQLLDYFVLYDALGRGIRLRLHITTDQALDRPHDHRFSFSSYIIRGSYRHTWHVFRRPIYDGARDEACRLWQNRTNPDPKSGIEFDAIQPIFTRHETAGSCYSLHHTAVHALATTPGTVSLALRGPAEKRRSIIMDSATQTYWWRYGNTDETPERRREKTMTLEDYGRLCGRLEELEVI